MAGCLTAVSRSSAYRPVGFRRDGFRSSAYRQEESPSDLPASPVSPDNAVCAAVAKDGIGDSVLLVSTDELLSVQPATRIPATRAADATSTMILFFFIGFVS
jgi:hypothetical protein